MLLPFAKIIRSEEETIKIAGNFARLLKPGDVVILTGNLGSGKTFFVRYAVKQFGIDSVSSPTFAIVNEYDGSMKIYHFDFYRIKNLMIILTTAKQCHLLNGAKCSPKCFPVQGMKLI